MKRTFSMIEGLIAFSLIVALASLLQPSMSMLVSKSFTQQCQMQLRSISGALKLYHYDNNHIYPGPSFTSQSPDYYRPNRNYYNDNTARYLSLYLETGINDVGRHYVKQYICPLNADLDLDSIPENRIQYRVHRIRGIGRVFGYPTRSWSNPSDPISFHALKSPSNSLLFADADRRNAGWINERLAPEEPSHENRSRNHLYADGHIQLTEIPK